MNVRRGPEILWHGRKRPINPPPCAAGHRGIMSRDSTFHRCCHAQAPLRSEPSRHVGCMRNGSCSVVAAAVARGMSVTTGSRFPGKWASLAALARLKRRRSQRDHPRGARRSSVNVGTTLYHLRDRKASASSSRGSARAPCCIAAGCGGTARPAGRRDQPTAHAKARRHPRRRHHARARVGPPICAEINVETQTSPALLFRHWVHDRDVNRSRHATAPWRFTSQLISEQSRQRPAVVLNVTEDSPGFTAAGWRLERSSPWRWCCVLFLAILSGGKFDARVAPRHHGDGKVAV